MIEQQHQTDLSAPFSLIEGKIESGFLITCDHASNNIPDQYDNLGLPAEQLERHIAYDIGAAGVTTYMAEKLGCPAVLTNFSRLLIDPNRGDDDPTLIMKLSDGAIIPGNRKVDEAETQMRLRTYYRPYHEKIKEIWQTALRKNIVPAIISIHSFTDRWKDDARKWHGGILWDADPRLPNYLIKRLAETSDFVIGDNQPYSGRLLQDSMYRHGTSQGIANALVEIRQDLIRSMEGQKQWADLLGGILEETKQNESLKKEIFQIRHFPSNTAE